MLNSKLIALLQRLYGFDSDIEILEKVEKGSLSENHILKVEKIKYFLKKYRFTEKERVDEVQSVKAFFAKRGIPVISPIVGQEGPFFEFESYFYSLFPFIEGEHLEWEQLTHEVLQNCGGMLARIHLESKRGHPGLVKPRSFAWNREKFFANTEAILSKIEEEKPCGEFSQKTKRFLEEKIKIAKANNLRYEDFDLEDDHLIHGDFHEENLFFRDRKIEYVFDWEKTNTAPRVIEIARAIEFFAFYGVYTEDNFERARVFLQSYHALYPISNIELRKGLEAWYWNQIYGLWILEEHYLKNNYRADMFLKNQLNYLEYHKENKQEYINRLVEYL